MNNSTHAGSSNLFSLQSIENSKNLIINSKEIVLLCHFNADADTAGCAIAMAKILRNLGKHVRIIYPNPPGYKRNLTLDYELIADCDIQPDLCMSFDAPTLKRFYWNEKFDKVPLISVDHHTNFEIQATESFVDSSAASACEVLARVIVAWDCQWLMIPGVAQILLEGQLSDSHTFRTSSSNKRSLETAGLLMDMGADFDAAKKAVSRLYKPDEFKFISQIIALGDFDQLSNSFAMFCTQETLEKANIHSDALGGLVSITSQMIEPDVTIFLYQPNSEGTKCSLRSKTKDVAAVCRTFGGGGHVRAAGFLSQERDCHKLIAAVRQEILKH